MAPESAGPQAPVGPGQTIRLSERDYRFGRGPVTLRITQVRLDASDWYEGQWWICLEGVPIRWDATEDEPRTLLARFSALPAKGK